MIGWVSKKSSKSWYDKLIDSRALFIILIVDTISQFLETIFNININFDGK